MTSALLTRKLAGDGHGNTSRQCRGQVLKAWCRERRRPSKGFPTQIQKILNDIHRLKGILWKHFGHQGEVGDMQVV